MKTLQMTPVFCLLKMEDVTRQQSSENLIVLAHNFLSGKQQERDWRTSLAVLHPANIWEDRISSLPDTHFWRVQTIVVPFFPHHLGWSSWEQPSSPSCCLCGAVGSHQHRFITAVPSREMPRRHQPPGQGFRGLQAWARNALGYHKNLQSQTQPNLTPVHTCAHTPQNLSFMEMAHGEQGVTLHYWK